MAHPKEFAEGLSIGIIMDGNGRWAKNRGLPRTAGHKKGAEVFSDIADYCDELGVSSVYFYAFSTENWKRPLEEVNAIMRLFGEYLLKGFDYKNRIHQPVLLFKAEGTVDLVNGDQRNGRDDQIKEQGVEGEHHADQYNDAHDRSNNTCFP